MQRAVADGPNHSPGCLPQAAAPCLTNRCRENGAEGSSANNDSICFSSLVDWPVRQSRPSLSIASVLASKLWPLRIMQPQPVSLVKPPLVFPICLSRVNAERPLAWPGSCGDRVIISKSERYVSQMRDSMSSTKPVGQCFCNASSSAVSTDERLLVSEDSCVLLPEFVCDIPGSEGYCRPRHHIGAGSVFVGIGSQKYWTRRLLYRERSVLFILGRRLPAINGGQVESWGVDCK